SSCSHTLLRALRPSKPPPPYSISDLASLFFFNDTATTEIYTLSLHDALPICAHSQPAGRARRRLECRAPRSFDDRARYDRQGGRSEEHTSELQSLTNLVCRLLLEKKKDYVRTVQCARPASWL